MNETGPQAGGGTASSAPLRNQLTHVRLTWIANKVEHWLRFGRRAEEKVLDRHDTMVSFAPGDIFAFVRWASNDYGTIISRIDIVRPVSFGEAYQTLPFVRPGGDILLRVHGWPKVERILHVIDAIEALSLDPADVAPDYWRHIHNRLAAGEEPRTYGKSQHEAWLKRRSIMQ